jgi:hypothetical protein
MKPPSMETTESEPIVDRRRLLGRGLLLGGAGIAGSALAAAPALPASADETRTTVFEVAMLGNTHRLILGPEVANFELRGSTFYVEGIIYPAGTIAAAPGFDPAAHQDKAVGHWFNSGWFMAGPDRPQPHRFSLQQHVFGLITPADLFPVDQISSQGTESSHTQDFLPSTRAITGGAGRYLGATGQITQYGHGTNVTSVNILGRVVPAPNFRFIFKLAKLG